MTGQFRGLSRNKRDDVWVYRRAIPKHLQHIVDRKNFVVSMRTVDYVEAKKRWAHVNRSYERTIRKAQLEVELAGPNAKNARRQVIWSAVARWLREYAIQSGGRLLLPPNVEIPVRGGMTTHPFLFVRDQFNQWAQENEPDAILVLSMADSTQGELFFHHALVGAYFIVRELLELGPMPERTDVIPPPLPGRWGKVALRSSG